MAAFKSGDYVLATKYKDGDPNDHWAVGFYDRKEGDRYFVKDGKDQQFRANGFRRVARIPNNIGAYLVENAREIEMSGHSVWGLVRRIRRRLNALDQ